LGAMTYLFIFCLSQRVFSQFLYSRELIEN